MEIKAPINERVNKQVMPLTKWFIEQYFQTYELMSKDSRYKTLPAYNQTSCIATVIIATNNAMDKSRDARKTAEQLQDISKNTLMSDIEDVLNKKSQDISDITAIGKF
jgi:hypothetical protein